MALPASDNFTYSDGNLETVGSSNWAIAIGSAAQFTIASNQLTGASGGGSGNTVYYWVPDTFSGQNDQKASLRYVSGSVGFSYGGAAVRINTSTGACYAIRVDPAQPVRQLVYFDGTNYTTLASDTTAASANDVYEVQASGTSISAYLNGSLLFGPITNSTLSSGRTGIIGRNTSTSVIFDDFATDVVGGGGASGNIKGQLMLSGMGC